LQKKQLLIILGTLVKANFVHLHRAPAIGLDQL